MLARVRTSLVFSQWGEWLRDRRPRWRRLDRGDEKLAEVVRRECEAGLELVCDARPLLRPRDAP